MSRNAHTNNNLAPSQSSSSTSQLDSPPVINQHFYTVNITFNYMAKSATPMDPAPSDNAERDLKMISRLAGQQMKDLYKEERRKSRKQSSSRRASRSSSRRSSREVTCPPEVDALPIVLEQDVTDDVTQLNSEESEISEVPAKNSRCSSEYQDIAGIIKQKYRIVPSKRVKPVPVDELPEKKFNKEKKRREYVILGKLNSLEPIPDKSAEEEKAEAKKKSRELARELY